MEKIIFMSGSFIKRVAFQVEETACIKLPRQKSTRHNQIKERNPIWLEC